MIDAIIHGTLIHTSDEGSNVLGRIVLENDKPIQFTARRGSLKRAMRAIPLGMPVSVAGHLTTSVRFDKNNCAYVHHEILITAVLTAQPKGLLGSIL